MERVNLEKVYVKAIEKIAQDEGIRDLQIDTTVGSNKGDNYLGEIYRVRLSGEKNGQPTSISVVLKKTSPTLSRDAVPSEEVFLREIHMYSTVLRELEKLQESEEIDSKCKFDFVKCLYHDSVYMEEMLVLEDLKEKGFLMGDRLKSADLAHTSLTMTALGKLHALSYVMKRRNPKLFKDIADSCPDILFNGVFGKSMEKLCAGMAAAFASLIRDEKLKVKIDDFANNLDAKMKAAVRPNKFSVILHGDSWINNMLFKYENGVPVDIRLLDYQLSRYGSPVTDILYFIFCCTDANFRSSYYKKMLDVYHESLTESLTAHSLDVKDFLSREDLESELKSHADFGLGMSMITLRAFMADSEETLDIQATAQKEVDENKTDLPTGAGYERLVKRVNEIAEDYINYGYLK